MAQQKNPLGASGATVASNVRRLREEQNLSYAELERRLIALGRKIPVLGLAHIERGQRRVDTDDLVALAIVLNVAPVGLLMPSAEVADDVVEVTGAGEVPAGRAWRWLIGEAPLGDLRLLRVLNFQAASAPGWIEPHVVPEDVEPAMRGDDGKGGQVIGDELAE